MSMKTTPWFDGSVKPVHVGVYERDYDSRFGYCKWNGRHWKCCAPTANQAEHEMLGSLVKNLPWRGLAEKPT